MQDKSNTETYRVVPKSSFIMVAGDIPPSRGPSGLLVIYQAGVDEIVQKGVVVAVGPDVKTTKVGDRVMFLYNTAVMLEKNSRDILHLSGPVKYLMKEIDVLSEAVPAPGNSDANGTNDICVCLKPDEVKKKRDTALDERTRERVVVPGRVVGKGF